MILRFLSWLCTSTAPAYVAGWNAVRAEQAAEATARLLLGQAGKARRDQEGRYRLVA